MVQIRSGSHSLSEVLHLDVSPSLINIILHTEIGLSDRDNNQSSTTLCGAL
jgi:hypothetical protein